MRKIGKLIVFEGTDCSGTTTVSKYVTKKLNDHVSRSTVRTFEPTRLPIGSFIRDILTGVYDVSDQLAMAHLFTADRLEHVEKFIMPNLNAGRNVICDRYYISTLVYQSLRGNLKDSIHFMDNKMREIILNNKILVPDCIILLDVDHRIALNRLDKRGVQKEKYEDSETQKNVIELYQHWFREQCVSITDAKKIHCINANQSLSVVQADSLSIVKEIFGW